MLKNIFSQFNWHCKTILRFVFVLFLSNSLGSIIAFSSIVAIDSATNRAMANSLDGLRAWPSPDETRVVLDVKSEVEFSYFTLTNPNRLVVDLKNTTLNAKLPLVVRGSTILSKIRQSTPPEVGTIRLVFELKHKSTPNIFKLKPTPGGQYGHRLVLDLQHNPTTQTGAVPQATPSQVTTATVKKKKDILIVIDPGHGGDDPGSIGAGRKYEKNATLAIAKKIAVQLAQIPGIKTRLTRNSDYFVNLNRRVAIARENDAHLLLSIHADAFTTPQPKGASVFVLNTRRANTEISRWVENHEKQSEILGGGNVVPSTINDKNVNQTLLDLQFSHSQKEGYKLAVDILAEMGKVTRLHNDNPINTSLAVLRSPQIPSVLIETGFISNPAEEKLLFQNQHQDKLAKAITHAVIKYLKANPPEGLSLTPKSNAVAKIHKVQRGDSLSVLSQQYGVTAQAIIEANRLKNSNLMIGQQLTIPVSNNAAVAAMEPALSKNTTAAQYTPPVVKTAATNYKVVKYTVVSGDYLNKIAKEHGVSVASIQRDNRLNSATLKKGQVLYITVPVQNTTERKRVASSTKTHVVRRGDTLSKIAEQYGVNMNSISRINRLKTTQLMVGQKLVIPAQ